MELYGLTEKEAKLKLEKFGRNVIEKKKNKAKVLFEIFLENLRDPFNFLMLLASLIALYINHYKEATLIFVFFLINMILGVYQEFKGFLSIEELKDNIKLEVLVIREGKKVRVNAEEIVPGDLVIISEGDLVPADGVIVDGKIKVDESLLTGEFDAKEKSKKDYVFKGTFVTEGKAVVKVTKTGLNTKVGQINKELIEIKKDKTLMEREVYKIIWMLFKLLSIFLVLVLGVGLIYKFSFDFLLLLSLSLLIAAIPQSLPVLVTLALSLAAKELAKQGILVKKLNAIEDMGLIDYLVMDKTGTIIENNFKIDKVYGKEEEVLKLAALSSANEKDPIDRVFLKYKDIEPDEVKYFNSKDKYSSAKLKDLVIYKGSPSVIFNLYLENNKKINKEELEKWDEIVEKEAKKGNKVIMVAYKKDNNFYIKGLVSLKVKLKKGVRELINKIRKEIKILILTGDRKENTAKVLKELGIKGLVLSRDEILNKSDLEILKVIDKVVAITDLFPEDKARIIKLLKLKGYGVAMLGDGVNDTLALKKADVSLVVGNGSDLAKGVADIVLSKQDLSLIYRLIQEGRNTIFTVKKLLLYTIPTNLVELLMGSFGVFIKKILLKPIQILWINLVTDSTPSFLFFGEKSKELRKKDVFPLLNIYDRKFLVITFFIFASFLFFTYNAIQKDLFLLIIIWEFFVFFFIKYYFDEESSLIYTLILLIVFSVQLLIIILLKDVFGYKAMDVQDVKLLIVHLFTFSVLEFILIDILKLKKLSKEFQ